MKKLLPLALLISSSLFAYAQEGPLPTQALVTVESKDAPQLTADDLTIEVDRVKNPPANLSPVTPDRMQVALLIDDGLRISVGRVLSDLKDFVTGLPPNVEIFIGYMQNGRVQQVSYFTTDHAAAASHIRLPTGLPGISASPYFCVSDFVRHWPEEGFDRGQGVRKARIVMMLTNGVDPFNGSTSPLNQDSPNVMTAQEDAQRAGIPIYSIYFGASGYRGAQSSFSGQNYLAQIAEATGGITYYQGTWSPVSLTPFLNEFQKSLSQTYLITFPASGKGLVHFSVKSKVPHVKVHAPLLIRPGNAQ